MLKETRISSLMTNQKIIFFGNGPLADYTLETLKNAGSEIIFHAREKADLEEVKRLKSADKTGELHGVLASFGVMIKNDILDLFEPEGILNIHPSLLPLYRGSSPIETAILNGDTTFSVSVMKLVSAMDAGPIFYQTTLTEQDIFGNTVVSSSEYKQAIYQKLASAGAKWLVGHLSDKPLSETCPSTSQDDDKATFTQKFDKSMSPLNPDKKTATELLNQIRAFSGFPKSKYQLFGLDCIIISAHVATPEEITKCAKNVHTLYIQCYDKSILIIDEIQPAGRKIMDAKSFLNGYAR